MVVRSIKKLREVMVEKKSGVQDFNRHVRHLMHTYRANKRAEPDSETLMAKLFDSYLVCKDQEYVVCGLYQAIQTSSL
jgi:hypothetical protein